MNTILNAIIQVEEHSNAAVYTLSVSREIYRLR